MPTSPRLARLTVTTLAVNLLVILWGAWVRASGSGAGCGRHWPLCDGQVIPSAPNAQMLTEFAHRATSGVALLMVIGMVLLSRRDLPTGHPARRWAARSLVFIVIEALVGAGLVLFQYVAHDASLGRAFWLGAHLLNTLLMLAAFGLTWWTALGNTTPSLRQVSTAQRWFLPGLLALLLTGMMGAVASLGDTLFPSRTLTEGIAADFSSASHLLLRLRVWHPLLAVATGVLWLSLAKSSLFHAADLRLRQVARLLAGMVLLQWMIGVAALLLLVPTVLQLLHLLSADLLWLTAVGFVVLRSTGQDPRTNEATNLAASGSNVRPAPLSK